MSYLIAWHGTPELWERIRVNRCASARSELHGGRSVSTGLVRRSQRAQVPSVLVKEAGNFQLPILTWQWLRKLRLHAPAPVAARLRRRRSIAKSGWRNVSLPRVA